MYLYLLLSLLALTSRTLSALYEDIKLLEEGLFTGYSSNIRPVNQSSDSVEVQVDVSVSKIVELVMAKEEMVTWLEFKVTWVDQRLRWDTRTYEDVTTVNVPRSKVWVPDLHVLKSTHMDRALKGHDFVQVSYEGGMQWYGEMETRTLCPMDVHQFPFDKQKCSIIIYPQFGAQGAINITHVNYIDSDIEVNGEWEIKSVTAQRTIVSKNQQDRSGVAIYCEVGRHAMYYIYTIIMPMITVFVVNPFVYLVKARSGEKTSTAVTLFLSFTLFISLLSGMIPQTSSSMPYVYILVYLQFQMSASVVIICILTDRLSHVTKPNLFVRLLSRLLRVKRSGKIVQVAPADGLDPGKKDLSKGDNSDDEPFNAAHLVDRVDKVLFYFNMVITLMFVTSLYLILSVRW